MANSNKCGMSDKQWAARRAARKSAPPTDPEFEAVWDAVMRGEMTKEEATRKLRELFNHEHQQ